MRGKKDNNENAGVKSGRSEADPRRDVETIKKRERTLSRSFL